MAWNWLLTIATRKARRRHGPLANAADNLRAHQGGGGGVASSNQDRISQLDLWGLMISELSEKVLSAGARVRFEDLLRVDELKALHAIAKVKHEALVDATGPERSDLEVEVEKAWTELAAAFNHQPDRRPGT
jgi:hypothetical protein